MAGQMIPKRPIAPFNLLRSNVLELILQNNFEELNVKVSLEYK
jgi:hypothetical protein